MLRVDKDALICDFAETYHIYDFESLSVRQMATLASGLREDSRICLKMSGQKVPMVQVLIAALIDRVTWLVTGSIENSAMDFLLGEQQKSEIEAFDTAEDFEKRRNEILRREDNCQ